jgi:hypothetical protein
MVDTVTASLALGRYAIYIELDFGKQGTVFLSFDDYGRWKMDTDQMAADELRGRLDQFQKQTQIEIRRRVEQAQQVKVQKK